MYGKRYKMKIIDHSANILYPGTEEDWIREAKYIELAARNCYKSEDKITEDSWKKMLKMLKENNHGAMLEFGNIIIRIVTDIRSKRDITRHRLCSFAVESTRYCNYSKDKFGNEITVVQPIEIWNKESVQYETWKQACEKAEWFYFTILAEGTKAENAATILPLSTKSDIIMKCNWREMLHVFDLRGKNSHAHPDVKYIFTKLQDECALKMPEVFV